MFRFCHPKCRLSHTRRSFVIFTGPAGVWFISQTIWLRFKTEQKGMPGNSVYTCQLTWFYEASSVTGGWVSPMGGGVWVQASALRCCLWVHPHPHRGTYLSKTLCRWSTPPTHGGLLNWSFEPSNRNSAVFFPSKKFVTVMLNLYFIFMEESEQSVGQLCAGWIAPQEPLTINQIALCTIQAEWVRIIFHVFPSPISDANLISG